MRIYIAGPMTGHIDLNFPAFDEARDYLLSLGHEVVSPADMDRAEGITPGQSEITKDMYEEALRRDIAALCTCDGIAFIPGWASSKGVECERYVASAIGLKMYYLRARYVVSGLELTEDQYA